MTFSHIIGGTRYIFATLRELPARATPARGGNALAGIAAASAEECMAAQFAWIPAEARRLHLTGVGLRPAPPQLAEDSLA